MEILTYINYAISILFGICYAYQFFYIPLAWCPSPKPKKPERLHDYAVLICARNEETVIADLIHSLKEQTYPTDHIHIFVMADNCTDGTAAAAQRAGACVYSRYSTEKIGKGYALEHLMVCLRRDYPQGFDGYFVFDADNILKPDYIAEMNKVFSNGADIVTGYRNSKNYGSSWISAGYALWFLRESRYLNHARSVLGSSCLVSGTGFLFSRAIAEDMGVWDYFLLTEDIEFSADQITRGRRIAYCPKAELYDEQPMDFATSWNQRMRWSRGYLQVFRDYGGKLLLGCFRGSFSCFDMTMAILPAFVLTSLSLIVNVLMGLWGAVCGADIRSALLSFGELLGNMYSLLFFLGSITLLTEWRKIRESAPRKIVYLFTFPLFMFTYVPISVVSLFHKTTWKPIAHVYSAEQMKKAQKSDVF